MTKCFAIVMNPMSGSGKCGRAWPVLARRLGEAGITFTLMTTERPGDGTTLARRALHEGATTVVAVGGDGTANEVVNGCFADEMLLNPAARFALIPAGTGNDLSGDLGLRGDDAITALGPDGITGHIDLLHVHYRDLAGQSASRYALQGFFFGVVAEGAGVALPPYVKRLGKRAYLGAGALAVLRHRPCRVAYRINDGPELCEWINGGIVANAAHIGGGLPIAPGARLDDGVADMVVLRAVSRTALLTRLMPRLQRGRHLTHPAISHASAHRVSLATGDALVLALDGEIVGYAPAEVTVMPGALPIALPPIASADC